MRITTALEGVDLARSEPLPIPLLTRRTRAPDTLRTMKGAAEAECTLSTAAAATGDKLTIGVETQGTPRTAWRARMPAEAGRGVRQAALRQLPRPHTDAMRSGVTAIVPTAATATDRATVVPLWHTHSLKCQPRCQPRLAQARRRCRVRLTVLPLTPLLLLPPPPPPLALLPTPLPTPLRTHLIPRTGDRVPCPALRPIAIHITRVAESVAEHRRFVGQLKSPLLLRVFFFKYEARSSRTWKAARTVLRLVSGQSARFA